MIDIHQNIMFLPQYFYKILMCFFKYMLLSCSRINMYKVKSLKDHFKLQEVKVWCKTVEIQRRNSRLSFSSLHCCRVGPSCAELAAMLDEIAVNRYKYSSQSPTWRHLAFLLFNDSPKPTKLFISSQKW